MPVPLRASLNAIRYPMTFAEQQERDGVLVKQDRGQ